MKYIFILILLFPGFVSLAQNQIKEANLRSTGLVGSGHNLPFWLLHNQLGKYSTSANWQELTEGKLFGSFPMTEKLILNYGADLSLLATENDFDAKIIQAYAGISGKTLSLKAGAFADKEILEGLSSGNGNIVRSLDYRPYPMIRLSTSGFVPFLFAQKWLRFKAEYDEGLLHDNRIVYHPHLHHKSLEVQFLTGKSFHLTAGMDHYVFWGGTLADGTKLPDGLKDYFRYILGRSGNSDFPETDQINVAGNQLGAYLFSVEKDFEQFRLQVRISHPFEDKSGMRLNNVQDNLYTLFIQRKKNHALIDALLLEFIYSKDQSRISPGNHRRPADNYFNHGIYKTGFSYHGYSLGIPLFFPVVKNEEGTITGFENTRISAFHTGAKGCLSQQLEWKALLTWSRNFGTSSSPYPSMREQCYSLLEFRWESSKYPLCVSTHLAGDFGNLVSDQWGVGIGLEWIIR